MTERYKDLHHFKSWYYAKDPSHVSFFHFTTFDFIACKMGFRLLFSNEKNVVIFQKETKRQNQMKVFEKPLLELQTN